VKERKREVRKEILINPNAFGFKMVIEEKKEGK
jgi:hypothetical protein